MANAAKYNRGACGHMLKHYERAKDENGEYVRFGNRDIDTSRSHLNYNLGPERSENQYSFIKRRCDEVYCLNRSDVNVLCSWVVTAPKALNPEDYERFFRKTYEALEGKYGRENVVSAYVHMDESGQPHIHFAFVPVVWDTKRERYTVKAKDVITKKELREFHPWLTEVMKQEFGRDIGIETGELGTRGNLTIEQYKTVQDANQRAERATREAQDMEERAAAATQEAEALESQIEVAGQQLQGIQDTMAAAKLEVATAQSAAAALETQIRAQQDRLEAATRDATIAEQTLERLQAEIGQTMQEAQVITAAAKDAQARLDSIEADLDRLETPEAVKAVQAHPAMMGGVKLSKEDWDLVKSWADRGAAAVAYGDDMQDVNDALRAELQQLREQNQRLQDEGQKKVEAQIRLANQQRELSLLQILFREIVAMFRQEPEMYATYRAHRYQKYKENEASFGRMDWQLQERLDKALGSNYAAQDKALYFGEHGKNQER